MSEAGQITTDDLTFCEVHPDRETALRCNKCNRLMCTECAVRTPVGYRCRECVRQHEDRFYTAGNNDNIIIFAVSAVLAGIGAAIVSAVGFLFLVIIVSFPVGGAISEAVLRAVQRRRGRYSGHISTAGVVVGGLIGAVIHAYSIYTSAMSEIAATLPPGQEIPAPPLDFLLFNMVLPRIEVLIFIGIVAFTVYGRFRMKF